MKKLFLLSILIPLATVCSCQKQDAAAEQQLAQRKTDLDAREKALDQRERALSDRERAIARAVTLPNLQARPLNKDSSSNVQPSSSIPGLAPPDGTQLKAGRERRMEEIRALRQRRLEAIQRMRSLGARATPSTAPANTDASAGSNESGDTGSSTTSGEATSPSPSPTP
jgi:hypothetical protein